MKSGPQNKAWPPKIWQRTLLVSLLMCLGIWALFFARAWASEDKPSTQLEAWEYAWGDSPRNDAGELTWIKSALPWKSFPQFPGIPPEEGRSSFLWLRATIPLHRIAEPSLFIPSVDELFEVYLEGKKIYAFGALDDPSNRTFQGYPWHIIRLASDAQGKQIVFRIYSNRRNIGLLSGISLKSYEVTHQEIIRSSLNQTLLGAFFSLLGLLLLALFNLNHREKPYLYLSIFAISTGIYCISGSSLRQLLYHNPIFWTFTETLSSMIAVPFLYLFSQNTLGKEPLKVLGALAKLHLLYAASVAVAGAWDAKYLTQSLAPFHVILCMGIGNLFLHALHGALKDDAEARIFTTGFFVVSLALFHDIASSNALLPWRLHLLHWGIFVFFCALLGILLLRYSQTQTSLSHALSTLQLSEKRLEILLRGTRKLMGVEERLDAILTCVGYLLALKQNLGFPCQIETYFMNPEIENRGTKMSFVVNSGAMHDPDRMPIEQLVFEETTLTENWGEQVLIIEGNTLHLNVGITSAQLEGYIRITSSSPLLRNPEFEKLARGLSQTLGLCFQNILYTEKLIEKERELSSARLEQMGMMAVYVGDRLANPLYVIQLGIEELADLAEHMSPTLENFDEMKDICGQLQQALQGVHGEFLKISKLRAHANGREINPLSVEPRELRRPA